MSGAGDSLKWYHVCSTLEHLPTVKRAVRQQRLKALFEAHRKKDSEIRAGRTTVPSGPHMYSLVRLLLPQLDRDEQGANVLYNMKEVGIARVFIDALNLKGTQSEVRLKAWKKPEGGEGYGHFAVVLYHQLIQPGRSHREGKQLTVADVNEFIDGMATVSGNHEEQKKLVTGLSKKASAFELKWIAKVLLRELRASATEELVYAAYHPDASELFKVDGRMREVIEKCRDPDKRIGDACIEVGKPFNPMLAEKTQDLEKITKVFKQKGFWIEPKLDGERMLLHMEDGDFRCFTRKHNEYTSLYKPVMDKIKPFVQAKTCILDGEILGWNRATERWTPFGNNVTLALKEGGKLPAGRHSDNNTSQMKDDESLKEAHLCVVLFDVLRIGDDRLENLPLASRRRRLHALIDKGALSAAGHVKLLEIVQHKEATKIEEVKEELMHQLHNDEEGVMLKDPDSVYKANKRDGGGWFKLKPEYIFGGTQDYDVVIIGGSHGKNKRSGSMWTWVCGIAVKQPHGQKYPNEFISFCRIGTGLKHHEFRELDKLMKPHQRKYDQKQYLKGEQPKRDGNMRIERTDKGVAVTFDEQRIGGEKLPAVTVWFSGNAQEEVECVFDPRKSVVLELTADYRLTDGGVWMAGRRDGEKRGWTLRFPRVKPKGIRLSELGGSDKPWHDVMTTSEFDEYIRRTKEGGEGLANSRQMKDALGKGGKTLFQARKTGNRVRRGGPATVDERFQAFVPNDSTVVTSDVLNGCIVCVLPADVGQDGVADRTEVQTMAHELGAVQVVHSDEFTTHIIAMCKDTEQIKTLKQHDKDIIEHLWIHECYENKTLVPLEPRHMLHISAKRREEFSQLYDMYEDSYGRDLTAEELRKKLDKKKLWEHMADDSDGEMSDEAKCDLEDGILDAFMESEQGQKAAVAQQSQAEWDPSLWGASLEPQLVHEEGGRKTVHDLVSWSLFRNVTAVCIEHVNMLAPSNSELHGGGEPRSKRLPAWCALAMAHLKAGGARAVEDPICVPRLPGNGAQQRLSSSFTAQRRELSDTKRFTHVVCSEEVLKSDPLGVQDQIKGLFGEVTIVTERWVENCSSYKKLLDPPGDSQFREWQQAARLLPTQDGHRGVFVSAPFPDHKEPEDVSSPAWLAIKAVIGEEVYDDDNLCEYLRDIVVTDGSRYWQAHFASCDEFEAEGKLVGECLVETWGATVVSVLKFPWGAVSRASRPPPVHDCCWHFSDKPGDWKKSWDKACSSGRELSVTWKNKGGDVETFSNFVAWLEEKKDADLVQATVMDLTSLLVAQAQSINAEIRAVDSNLDDAQEMQNRAEESLARIGARRERDWKLVTQAGVEFVNRAKRPFRELEVREAEADAAEAYDSNDERASDTAADDMDFDGGGAHGGSSGAGGGGQGLTQGRVAGSEGMGGGQRAKPKPKKAKQREAESSLP